MTEKPKAPTGQPSSALRNSSPVATQTVLGPPKVTRSGGSAEERKVLVLGAGGYAGGELLRLVCAHPRLELAAALSRSKAGTPVGAHHPNLAPLTDVSFADPAAFDWKSLNDGGWVLFSALGHGETMGTLPAIVGRLDGCDALVVDLSGDFRLDDPDTYAAHYGQDHAAPELLERFVYGLPELRRDRIAAARLIASPGCLATGAQLALLPAAAADVTITAVAVDGKTGSSGAGARPGPWTHHPARMNNFSAYKQTGHRHQPEIEAGFAAAGGSAGVPLSFVPHRAPLVRGIFTTAHLFCGGPVSADAARGWYASYYAGSPFVRIVDDTPQVAAVSGTNRCDLSVTVQGDSQLVVCTAIDNLMKGAAGQAVQCANIAAGWAETEGLLLPAPSPV